MIPKSDTQISDSPLLIERGISMRLVNLTKRVM